MSDELRKDKEVITLEKKLRSHPGGTDYVEDLRSLDIVGLEEKLKDMAKYRQAIISTRGKDEELARARKKVNGLNLPYTQDLAANAEKSRFIGLLMQEIEGFEPTQDIQLED